MVKIDLQWAEKTPFSNEANLKFIFPINYKIIHKSKVFEKDFFENIIHLYSYFYDAIKSVNLHRTLTKH